MFRSNYQTIILRTLFTEIWTPSNLISEKWKFEIGYISFTLMHKNTLHYSGVRRRNVPHRSCWRPYCWHPKDLRPFCWQRKVAATILLAPNWRRRFDGDQKTATNSRTPKKIILQIRDKCFATSQSKLRHIFFPVQDCSYQWDLFCFPT